MMNASFGPAPDMLRELNRLQSVLDQVFRPAERSSIRPLAGTTFPVLNVGTTPETIEVMALAPGLDPKSLQLTVDRGVLTIAGERQSEIPDEGDGLSIYAQERFTGSFRRVVSLPEEADAAKVDASYRDGILRITVAKHEASKPRRIEIS
jgi:HSP20 family protein